MNPGIEILVRDVPPDRLAGWLSGVVGPLGRPTEAGESVVYRTRFGPVVVSSVVDRPGSASVWFNAAEWPWSSSAACARQAARALRCSVLCDPGTEYPDVDPLSDVMLEVSADGERLTVPDL